MENNYVDSRLALVKHYIKIRQYPIILGFLAFLGFISIAVPLAVLFHRTAEISEIIKKLDEIQEKTDKIDFQIRASSAESCDELQQHGINQNGYYPIDVDGRYQGLPSTRIYCDFSDKYPKMVMFTHTNRSIRLSSSTNFTIDVTYDTNLEAMKSVIEKSNYCFQEITFECQQMPLHTQRQNHAVWLDNQGNPHYFFDGSKQLNRNDRQCACGKFGGCQGRNHVLCNCDLNFPHWTADHGKIDDKELLPITQFNYLGMGNGKAKLTIGNVTCENYSCPFGWTKMGSGSAAVASCFRWLGWSEKLATTLPLATAKNQCKALGGHVAAPHNQEQNQWMAEFAKKTGMAQFIIGIEKKDTKLVFLFGTFSEMRI